MNRNNNLQSNISLKLLLFSRCIHLSQIMCTLHMGIIWVKILAYVQGEGCWSLEPLLAMNLSICIEEVCMYAPNTFICLCKCISGCTSASQCLWGTQPICYQLCKRLSSFFRENESTSILQGLPSNAFSKCDLELVCGYVYYVDFGLKQGLDDVLTYSSPECTKKDQIIIGTSFHSKSIPLNKCTCG